ncbi:hypothetical protein CWE12_12560 [Aliidiomarina sedimenti]|uniref:FAD-binding domain-containing protein n=1 Tax=Aliidiomarina sedimenti TaxID=1933879 RepID=A0ABY0BV07_9GAMM|nr:FAD-dependent oxidoreductase [Aliidiomarina sedimenti]RUO28051.1 hypothetical protein CWE12_12560 [Aliidiomarina sedimenti]
MALHRTQVVVVGGGMIGLSLALSLAKRGRQVVVVEKRTDKGVIPDTQQLRVSAISEGSRHWLEQIGVWQALPEARLGPYTGMQVWDRDNGAEIEFAASDAGFTTLGHIVENAVLEALLWQQAEAAGVQLLSGVEHEAPVFSEQDVTLSLSNGDIVLAQLLVAADGAQSTLRSQADTPMVFKDYEQQGLVATIRSEKPHQGIARQAFMPGGPLALLPLADPHLLSIVWSQPSVQAEQWSVEDEEVFNHRLTAASDNCLGLLTVEGPRRNFPLQMRYAEQWLYQRQVLIGDAAHTIHPLAGQGANLGLADARDLEARLAALGTLNGVWDEAELMRTLRGYQRARKAAALQHIAVMEGFHQLFRGSNPLLRFIRGRGLNLVNRQPLLKQFFLSQASK